MRTLLAALIVLAACGGKGEPRARDGAVEVDAVESPCPSGSHLCNGACASNNAPETCGVSCIPCSPPPGGTATCDGTSCGATCPTGKKLCAGVCIDDLTACGDVCPPGTHACGANCSPDTAPNSCGRSCMPCPSPANGAATCVNGACSVSCQSGYHRCGSSCVSSTDPATCGTSCTPCPVPMNGIATCEGSVCGVACPGRQVCGDICIETNRSCDGVCPAGRHDCNGFCVSDLEPTHCGASCTPCPVPANGAATCNGMACGTTCAAGFHRCGTICASNTSTASCGPTSCMPCPVPANGSATCDATKCGAVCGAGLHACGTECADNKSPATCGSRCMACDSPPNAHATCDGTSCGYECDVGAFTCGNKACGRMSWELESGTLEGWHVAEQIEGRVLGLRSSGAFSHSGTRSLALDIISTTGLTSLSVTLLTPLCPGAPTDINGKLVTAFVRIEGPPSSTDALIFNVTTPDGGGNFGPQVDRIKVGEWTRVQARFDTTITYQLGVLFNLSFDNLTLPRWSGTIYVDSMTIN